MKMVIAAGYHDIFNLQANLDRGEMVVVELSNKFFRTRIMDDGKRIRVTNVFTKEFYDIKLMGVEEKARRFIRVRTQLTRNGHVLKFEGYFIQLNYTATDLNEELLKHL